MKKLILGISTILIVSSCSTSKINRNSIYDRGDFKKGNTAVVIGGAEARFEQKDSADIVSSSYHMLSGLFSSEKAVKERIAKKKTIVGKSFAHMRFVREENRTLKENVEDPTYFDLKLGGNHTNTVDEISITETKPGKYYLKNVNFIVLKVKTLSGSTGEYREPIFKEVENQVLELKAGDVIYVGNFEFNYFKDIHTTKFIDLSKKIKAFLKKDYPELSDQMKIKFLNIN